MAGSPDFFALLVANHILGGGGFSSRLTEEVREKRGLTYGVSSGFSPALHAGAFTISLQTRPDQAQQAIDLGLFGVPSMVVNGQVFWGNDALPMLRAYLEGDAWFESADWRDAGKLPVGIRRAPAAK